MNLLPYYFDEKRKGFFSKLDFLLIGNQSSMSCDQDQDNQDVETMEEANNWPPQVPLTVSGDKNKKKPGIIYLSSIPPGFNVSCTIAFFSQFGKVGRVFLQPGI